MFQNEKNKYFVRIKCLNCGHIMNGQGFKGNAIEKHYLTNIVCENCECKGFSKVNV